MNKMVDAVISDTLLRIHTSTHPYKSAVCVCVWFDTSELPFSIPFYVHILCSYVN